MTSLHDIITQSFPPVARGHCRSPAGSRSLVSSPHSPAAFTLRGTGGVRRSRAVSQHERRGDFVLLPLRKPVLAFSARGLSVRGRSRAAGCSAWAGSRGRGLARAPHPACSPWPWVGRSPSIRPCSRARCAGARSVSSFERWQSWLQPALFARSSRACWLTKRLQLSARVRGMQRLAAGRRPVGRGRAVGVRAKLGRFTAGGS